MRRNEGRLRKKRLPETGQVDQVVAVSPIAVQKNDEVPGSPAGGRWQAWSIEKGDLGHWELLRWVFPFRGVGVGRMLLLQFHEGQSDQHGCQDQEPRKCERRTGK